MNHSGDTNKMVGEDHIRDATKMVSDTPMTDAHIDGLRRDQEVSGCDRTLDFARTLERELNAANAKIKRMEEAGDMMVQHFYTNEPRSVMWEKAKEDKP